MSTTANQYTSNTNILYSPRTRKYDWELSLVQLGSCWRRLHAWRCLACRRFTTVNYCSTADEVWTADKRSTTSSSVHADDTRRTQEETLNSLAADSSVLLAAAGTASTTINVSRSWITIFIRPKVTRFDFIFILRSHATKLCKKTNIRVHTVRLPVCELRTCCSATLWTPPQVAFPAASCR